jgi:hypothetical protein
VSIAEGSVSVTGAGFVDPIRDDRAVTNGAPNVVAASISSKMDQRTRRVHFEVSFAPQGVVPPSDS